MKNNFLLFIALYSISQLSYTRTPEEEQEIRELRNTVTMLARILAEKEAQEVEIQNIHLQQEKQKRNATEKAKKEWEEKNWLQKTGTMIAVHTEDFCHGFLIPAAKQHLAQQIVGAAVPKAALSLDLATGHVGLRFGELLYHPAEQRQINRIRRENPDLDEHLRDLSDDEVAAGLRAKIQRQRQQAAQNDDGVGAQ